MCFWGKHVFLENLFLEKHMFLEKHLAGKNHPQITFHPSLFTFHRGRPETLTDKKSESVTYGQTYLQTDMGIG